MSKNKFFRATASLLRQHSVVLSILGCVCVLSFAPFSTRCEAQSPPPSPQSMPAWQPPETQTTVADRTFAAPPSFDQPKTAMTNLRPPRDIFTQQAPQPQERFAARPLKSSVPLPTTNPSFNLQNTMSEAFGSSVVRTNLETPSPFQSSMGTSSTSVDPLSDLAENAAAKIGGVKDWMSDKTASFLDAGNSTEGGWMQRLSSMLGGADIKRIGGSLCIVLGGYLGLVWLLRKINPSGNQGIPTEVLEVVGNAPLDNRQNLQLVRLGSKLLLMIHGPDGTQPIGEVTDPAEVDHLVALCNGRTRTANAAVSRAVNRHRSNQPGGSQLNLSENQQSNLKQLLSAFDQTNRSNGNNITRSYEA